jgi:intracellular multiplication protein IcmW
LQAIDVVHPGSASRVLIKAEETSLGSHDPAGFFLKRNIVFERLRLLARVFCQYRLNLVVRALEGDE